MEKMVSENGCAQIQCKEPGNAGTDAVGVNSFPYLGSGILHPPRRLCAADEGYWYRW